MGNMPDRNLTCLKNYPNTGLGVQRSRERDPRGGRSPAPNPQGSLDPCPLRPSNIVRARGPNGEMSSLRCKQWGCDACGPWLKKRLRRGIINQAEANELQRFLTITLPSSVRGLAPADQWRIEQRVWNRLRNRLVRKYPKLRFLWVREPHKNGTPHRHALISHYIPQTWLSQVVADCGGGRVVDIRFVDAHRVGAYLSKYLSKDAAAPPHGFRKYGAAKGIDLDVRPTGDGTWHLELNTGPFWVSCADPGAVFGGLRREMDEDAGRALVAAHLARLNERRRLRGLKVWEWAS